MSFATLYDENCAGCHGIGGRPGAAVALDDPVYLALVDDATLRRVTSDGVPSTAMPGFGHGAGGPLSAQQIEVIVGGIAARRRPGFVGASPPPYAAAPGDPGRGRAAYATHCASCHGPTGAGSERSGSIVDGSYLALVSNQGLRTSVLVGRPALGMPDWRGDATRSAMTTQEIADVVAWLIGKRPAFPGQPYPVEHTDG